VVTREIDRANARATAVFLFVTTLNAAPLLWFRYLPLTDGPSHVYNASLMVRYFLEQSEVVRHTLLFNPSLPPNLMAHALMALAIAMGASPLAAERLLLVAYALLLPLALRYAVRGVTARTHGVEYLALPLVFNSNFHWGFYNFVLALVGYLFALGLWLRIREHGPTAQKTLALGAILVGLYFCHPVPLVEFWIAAAVIIAADAVRTRAVSYRQIGHLAASSAAPCLLLCHYVLTRPVGLAGGPAAGWPSARYAGSLLVKLAPLATYTVAERAAAIGLSLMLCTALVHAARTRLRARTTGALLLAAAVAAVIVFAAPTQAGGGTLVTPRLVYFPLFLVLMGLATFDWPRRTALGCAAVGVTLAVIGSSARWPVYERYDERMRAFVATAEAWPRSSTLYFWTVGDGTAMVLDDTGTPPVPAGAWGYVAARHAQLLLSDYESLLGYFPFVYRTPVALRPGLLDVPCRMSEHASLGQALGTLVPSAPVLVWVDAGRIAEAACVREQSETALLAVDGGSMFAWPHTLDRGSTR